jgi:hypothetical protein
VLFLRNAVYVLRVGKPQRREPGGFRRSFVSYERIIAVSDLLNVKRLGISRALCGMVWRQRGEQFKDTTALIDAGKGYLFASRQARHKYGIVPAR